MSALQAFLAALAAPLLYMFLFWGLYVLVMGLYRAKLDGRLSRSARILGAPYLLVGYAMDVFCQMTLATALFMEWPRELLVTARLKRHLAGSGWRYEIAKWMCDALLDPFDPTGAHCD